MRYIHIKSAWQGHSDCRNCTLREMVLFSDLQEQDFLIVHEQIDDMAFPPNAVMFHMGARAEAVYTVRRGAVKLVRYSSNGAQRVVRVLKKGDVVGLEALLGNAYEHTAVTLNEVEVCRIPLPVMQRLDRETQRLERRLMERWQRALSEAHTWLAELTGGMADARTRVARLLLRMRVLGDDGELLVCMPSREDIGSILGITVETASRIISSFQRDGLIQSVDGRNRLYRADIPVLEQIAAGPADGY
ncbi:MAG: Crp/Fnr family transcriptional regulator [Betaproteobacteria bacterium]|nr:Crp/Fnr family transcriptional regulator [Betaproteobacteria bacterium]